MSFRAAVALLLLAPTAPASALAAPYADFQWENQLAFPLAERQHFARTITGWGANSTTLSLLCGDDARVNILTATYEQRDEWRLYLAWLNSIGIKPTAYVGGEFEHNNTFPGPPPANWQPLPLEQILRAVDLAQGVLGDADAYLVIREEYDEPVWFGRAVAEAIRAKMPGRKIAIHPPHHERYFEPTVRDLAARGLLDIVLLQCTAAEVPAQAARWQALGLEVIAHEQLNGTTPAGLAEWMRAARDSGCVGWSIYPGYDPPVTDLDARDPSSYAAEWMRLTRPDPLQIGWTVWPLDRNRDGALDTGDLTVWTPQETQ